MATLQPIKLLLVPGHQKSKEAREFLQSKGIPFKEVDVRDILAYLARDLGAEDLPVLVTPKGVFVGLESIRRNFE